MSSSANSGSYQEEVEDILQKFDEALNNNQIMYVNLHPLVKDKIEINGFKHIVKFPDDIDNYAFLNAVDILITDYSSVFFDFSITKKQIVLFMYDYEEYMAERGMYIDVKTLPFEKIYKIDEMMKYLSKKQKDTKIKTEDFEIYYDKFNSFDKKDSIIALNDMIFYDKESDLKVFDYSKNKLVEHTLYLADKIKHKNNYKNLEAIDDLENPIAVFLRRDFTSHTLDILNQKYNDYLDYIVIDTHMFMSMWENIRLYFARERKKYSCDDIFSMELNRLLPNIKINEVVAEGEIYRNNSIKHAVDNRKN